MLCPYVAYNNPILGGCPIPTLSGFERGRPRGVANRGTSEEFVQVMLHYGSAWMHIYAMFPAVANSATCALRSDAECQWHGLRRLFDWPLLVHVCASLVGC